MLIEPHRILIDAQFEGCWKTIRACHYCKKVSTLEGLARKITDSMDRIKGIPRDHEVGCFPSLEVLNSIDEMMYSIPADTAKAAALLETSCTATELRHGKADPNVWTQLAEHLQSVKESQEKGTHDQSARPTLDLCTFAAWLDRPVSCIVVQHVDDLCTVLDRQESLFCNMHTQRK